MNLPHRYLRLGRAALLLLGLAPALIPESEPQNKITSETLLRSSSSWDGVSYGAYPKGTPELSVLRILIPAHTTMKWHSHPVPNVAYLVSGEITVEELESPKTRHFTAGQVVPETVNTLHRGVTGDKPVVLLVFYAGSKGVPLSEPKH